MLAGAWPASIRLAKGNMNNLSWLYAHKARKFAAAPVRVAHPARAVTPADEGALCRCRENRAC